MIKYIGFDKDRTLFNFFNLYAEEWGRIIYSMFGVDRKKEEDVFKIRLLEGLLFSSGRLALFLFQW